MTRKRFSDRPLPCRQCAGRSVPPFLCWGGDGAVYCSKECLSAAEVKKALMQCGECLGLGRHRYADNPGGTPNHINSAPCGHCAGTGKA